MLILQESEKSILAFSIVHFHLSNNNVNFEKNYKMRTG